MAGQLSLPRAVAMGGLTVGILDGLDAVIFFGLRSGTPPPRIFQAIAAGLVGRGAFEGGTAMALLGLGLHFLIATVIVAVACGLVRAIPALTTRPLLAGAVYGVGAWLVMNFVVLPLSALGRGPLVLPVAINGILIHIAGVGIPALYFAGRSRPAPRLVTRPAS